MNSLIHRSCMVRGRIPVGGDPDYLLGVNYCVVGKPSKASELGDGD